MRKIEVLGDFNLTATSGWLPLNSFCQNMPFTKEKVKGLRHSGQWLDGVVTKCFRKEIWVNVWEVSLWLERSGFH